MSEQVARMIRHGLHGTLAALGLFLVQPGSATFADESNASLQLSVDVVETCDVAVENSGEASSGGCTSAAMISVATMSPPLSAALLEYGVLPDSDVTYVEVIY